MDPERPELVFSGLPKEVFFRPLHYPVDAKLVALCMETGDRPSFYADYTELAPPGLATTYSRLCYLQDHSMPSGGEAVAGRGIWPFPGRGT